MGGLPAGETGARLFDCRFALALAGRRGFARGGDDGRIRSFGSAGVERRVRSVLDPELDPQDRIYVRRELLFDPDATQVADVLAMFESTPFPAVRLHAVLEDAGLLGTSVD